MYREHAWFYASMSLLDGMICPLEIVSGSRVEVMNSSLAVFQVPVGDVST